MAELKRHRDVPKERVLEGLTHPCDTPKPERLGPQQETTTQSQRITPQAS